MKFCAMTSIESNTHTHKISFSLDHDDAYAHQIIEKAIKFCKFISPNTMIQRHKHTVSKIAFKCNQKVSTNLDFDSLDQASISENASAIATKKRYLRKRNSNDVSGAHTSSTLHIETPLLAGKTLSHEEINSPIQFRA